MSDAALMREIALGMQDALSELMDRYMLLVSRTAYRILCDRHVSDDVTREVFVRIWRDASRFDERFNVSTWIYRITCGLCLDRLRKWRFLEYFSVRQPVYEVSAPQASSAGEDYITRESWDIFCRASRNLSPKQRMVFVLKELEELPFKEVYAITGMSPGRIRSNLYMARAKIRSELELYGEVR